MYGPPTTVIFPSGGGGSHSSSILGATGHFKAPAPADKGGGRMLLGTWRFSANQFAKPCLLGLPLYLRVSQHPLWLELQWAA